MSLKNTLPNECRTTVQRTFGYHLTEFLYTQLGLMWMMLQFGRQSLEAVHRTCSWTRLLWIQWGCTSGVLQSVLQWELCSVWTVWTAALGGFKLLWFYWQWNHLHLRSAWKHFAVLLEAMCITEVSSIQPQTKTFNTSKESRDACSPPAMSNLQQHCTAPIYYWI